MPISLEPILHDLGIAEAVVDAHEVAILRTLIREGGESLDQRDVQKLPRIGLLLETEALRRSIGRRDESDAGDLMRSAYICWESLAGTRNGAVNESWPTQKAVEVYSTELPADFLNAPLAIAFHLAVAGTLGERSAQASLDLRSFSLDRSESDLAWKDRVVNDVFVSFCLLVRKQNGWSDVSTALELIQSLRSLQRENEDDYLNAQADGRDLYEAYQLAGLYHLAQIVTLTADYLTSGDPGRAQLEPRLDRHRDRASRAFHAGRQAIGIHFCQLLWAGCRALLRNSLWSHVTGLGIAIEEFARSLASQGRPNPVIELWPSQQHALRQNVLSTYPRAILVEMPTSAGKTLLAKFLIVQTKALNPSGTVAYVVPTRALVNQVTRDLRQDFRELESPLRVEQAVPAFEIDPTENRLLSDAPDVLVTTPEKLDLLVRRDHPAVSSVALVIADEAHNLGDGIRGSRLELLLGTIKRDRPGARFLLLSPFLPRSDELVEWLGDDRTLPPIHIDWRPSRKVVGALRKRQKGGVSFLEFSTLPAADNADVRGEYPLRLISSQSGFSSSKSALSRMAVAALGDQGAVLILTRGPGTATSRAQEIANDLPTPAPSSARDAVQRYVAAELGASSPLVSCLNRGVAYHHSGISQESRWLIESLIRRKDVGVVCGTTTLAQGVNFPIRTVIIEGLKKGSADLTYQDFWNIAGRAGRALIDSLGVVAFTATSARDANTFKQFLEGEATQISSQLSVLIDRLDDIAEQFGSLRLLRQTPELSGFLQFLAHAMRVSGADTAADEMEDLLRASLLYRQTERERPDLAERLVTVCRAYLDQISSTPGVVQLADRTGFATPSVLRILSDSQEQRGLQDVDEWHPSRLFGEDLDPLTVRIDAIAQIPEIRLGQADISEFSPRLVAAILRDWVSGRSLSEMAAEHWRGSEADPNKRVAEFSKYLFSVLLGRASWGLGALETICFAGKEIEQLGEEGYVPSMVFFGVQSKEAVWMRMVGVPRLVSEQLGARWGRDRRTEPESYEQIRSWVSSLSEQSWSEVLPPDTQLSSEDMRFIWSELAG